MNADPGGHAKETCCRFGPDARLAGIVTEPRGGPPRAGLVLVSAGLAPKHGPYRLYAELARRLAADGVATLRFDLGGLGDSEPDRSGQPLQQRTEREVGAALDHLAGRFELVDLALGGLCSGADDSLRGAAADERVARAVLIDPFAYRTAGWYWRHGLHRLTRRTFRALGLYEPPAPRRTPAEVAGTVQGRVVTYEPMDRAEATELLRTVLARGARVHFVYTAGARASFNHATQLAAMLPELHLGDRVTLDHLPHVDHTPMLEGDRRLVLESVARRLLE